MTQEQKFIEISKLYFPIDEKLVYSKELLIDIKLRREYFIEGCEYQLKEQKRSYSEEDMQEMYNYGYNNYLPYEKAIEQFKNKYEKTNSSTMATR